jgi:outer membrane protein OmpA-like peptidoglycan-associated protein
LIQAYSVGGGIAFKLNDKWNIGLEQRFTIPTFGNDYLDGLKKGNTNDAWSYSMIRLNWNIGNSATHVQPLWWINPNNYVYSELTTPKHLKILPILPDADGDGVTDQFDLEPNTPAGAPVDSHGRAKDTDGDGVPDYKDKEILTPQSCFPVNADGVGTCPEPACCKEIKAMLDTMDLEGRHHKCNLSSLPSIAFKAGSYKLSKDAQTILTSAAAQLQANPTCNVKVVGYVTDASKKAQQLSWDRVNSVIKYLVEKASISESRVIFSYDTNGSSNSVDLIPTTEIGPNTAPAPAPNFRSKK